MYLGKTALQWRIQRRVRWVLVVLHLRQRWRGRAKRDEAGRYSVKQSAIETKSENPASDIPGT